jgi:hypothetical protein
MCCLHLQEREIIERGHHISVFRVHVKLPYLSPLTKVACHWIVVRYPMNHGVEKSLGRPASLNIAVF